MNCLMDTTAQSSALPRLNEKAPAFQAPSTQGDISLDDYKGKWVVLFSHPADFTPVCTTEFLGFANHAEDFRRINTQLLGLSIDSVYSHIAWLRNIKDNFGVEVDFPLIADISMDVARAYGMLHPGASSTAAVRAVFVIDPEQIVRAMIYYPMTAGRAVSEIYRVVQALQTNLEKGLPTPEGWQPGDPCILPAPKTSKEAEERMKSGAQVTDWYFAKTKEAKKSAA
jgi:peroxiredoxin 2/4